MKMSEWLTLELDMKPYRCDMEKVGGLLGEIDAKLKQFYDYCKLHPNFEKEMFSKTAQERRSRETALAFLGIEKPISIDAKSSLEKSEGERFVENQNMKKLLAYTNASQYMKDILHSEAPFLDQSICLRAHATMCQGEEDKHLIIRYDRFRNESDPTLIIGQGYFAPVDGDLVQARMDYLFQNLFYGQWFGDHPIVRASKFLAEYFRIQPHMDGNKRMALLCMNFILQKEGYADVRFRNEQKERLFEALKTALLTRDVTELVQVVAEKENRRCDQWLEELVDYRLRIREDEEADLGESEDSKQLKTKEQEDEKVIEEKTEEKQKKEVVPGDEE